ncbi:LysM peptidoglycan-binding domain-containing protein, partial [Kocuria palustris]
DAAGGAAGAEGGAGAEGAAGAEGGAAAGAADPYNGGVPESVGVPPGAAPSIQPGPYTVTQGDTLGYISTLSGITVDDIAAANGLSNVDQLEVGQTITIPEAG